MAFEDTFTRADNAATLGSPWIVQPSFDADGSFVSAFGIESNKGLYTGFESLNPAFLGGDNWANAAAVVDVGSGDMAVEWDAEWAGNVDTYYMFRTAAPDDTLLLTGRSSDPDVIRMHRYDPGGGNTVLGTVSAPGWRTKRVRVDAIGSAITVSVDGSAVMAATSSHNQTVPYAGIGGQAIAQGGRAAWSSGYPSGGEVSATVDLGSPIQECEWVFDSDSAGYTYHVFRCVDNDNYWFVYRPTGSATTLDLYQRVAGSNTRVARATGVSWPAGSVLRVEAGSSSIVVKIDGSTVLTYTTAAGSGDRAGLGGYTASGSFGQWTRFYGHGSATYETLFKRPPGTGLGPEWSTPSSTWSTYNFAPWQFVGLSQTRWRRFWCESLARAGFRNLGLTRGARSVT